MLVKHSTTELRPQSWPVFFICIRIKLPYRTVKCYSVNLI
jgi:hypothetical protein